MRLRFVAVLVCLLTFSSFGWTQNNFWTKAVESYRVAFVPASAQPGGTVVCTIELKLRPGYHTYPLTQDDPQASNMINTIVWPESKTLIPVADALNPENPLSKEESILGIKKLNYYEGTVVYRRTYVLSPMASSGAMTIKVPKCSISICNQNTCFAPKKLDLSATLKVLPGKVEIDPKYRQAVQKYLDNQ